MKKLIALPLIAAVSASVTAFADVVVENGRFKLVLGDNARAKSLVVKATGEEMLDPAEDIPAFSVIQDRPFNNEVKLIHPNKRTTYWANRLRRDGDRLVVGFEIAPYEAVVELKATDAYVAFRLADFLVDKDDYGYLKMDQPPVASFRVLQLPVLNRRNFGNWLNASWDEETAVGVVGTSPFVDIDHERRKGCRILTADLLRGIRLKGGAAALVAANGKEDFLDCMDALERDYDLPRGVASRRSKDVNASIYHLSGEITLDNIDRHIAYAKKAGLRFMTFSYNFYEEIESWGLCGQYDWSKNYPNGEADVKKVLAKVKAAGITPGLHTLHTHIGLKSRYVTPVADPRLHLTRHFTLARPLGAETNLTELAVQESTEGTTMFGPCRILKFGGELLSYESYTKEPPYRFLGVRRGAHATTVVAHPRGEIGGILDISEFGTPLSCYFDQDSDLQDELGAKLARLYNCGFEYMYFDGSEGVHPPFNIHVANSQYRLWKLLEPKPLFSEGAAKTHFGWHILSGANAFDVFSPGVFKEKIVQFPLAQAPISAQDMTRVNFGWWCFYPPVKPPVESAYWTGDLGTQVDMWEFAEAKSIGWDCPASLLMQLDLLDQHPRVNDVLEAVRRWEAFRERGGFSDEVRAALRDPKREHHLYLNARGECELHEITMLPTPEKAPKLRGFVFERNGRRVVAYWHTCADGRFTAALGDGGATVELAAGDLKYLETDLSQNEVERNWREIK